MNETIFFFFYNLSHRSDFFDNLIVFLAVDFIYIVIALAYFFLIFHYKIFPSQNSIREFIDKWKGFITLTVSGISAYVLAKILKVLFHTERPFDMFVGVQSLFFESGYAFPSGHTLVATAVAFALFFINKKVGYLFMFFAVIIGLARITAGVHFPIDILGGFTLGALIVFLVAYLVKKI